MIKRASKPKTSTLRRRIRSAVGWVARRVVLVGLLIAALATLWIALYGVIAPPTTPYMIAEGRRTGGITRDWVPIEDIAISLQRAVVAAEDANYCLHWGFDMTAIRSAINAGAARGGSTISQQTTKNAFLWHGRSWPRKALEALMTPMVEALWSKLRILEVYLNIIEFDEGVFGAEAAAQHYFGVSAANLSDVQSARLAAILPNPQGRSASNPSSQTRNRTAQILDGAATIRADGRDSCFAR
ncbi:MAG: monofunctional biosynthetic peptidoglycan transglycosylase [Paracoccaceae bacterium]